MWLIQFGEVVFGGVGSGLYGMLAFAIVAVFIGGLMVGRTPEYLGKKIEAFEMKMASLVILFPAMVILLGTAIACVVPGGHGDARQSRRARLQRDPLRLHVRRRQQRLGLRRHHGERPVLRGRDRDRDVHRPLLADRADPGDRRRARGEEERARDGGDAPDPRRRSSSRCSPARSCWWARSPSSPRWRSARSSSTCSSSRSDPEATCPRIAQARPLFDAPIVQRALLDSVRKLDPRHMVRNPVMFVVEVGSAFTTLLGLHALATGQGEAPAGFILADRGLALVHRALRQLRRGDGRGPRQGPGGRPAQGAARRGREAAARGPARRAPREGAVAAAAQGRRRAGRGGRHHPRRRRRDRRHRLGRRGGDHRRERARDPRERRRPQRRHRRHARALRLARRARQRESGRDLPRPHDRAGRGREAPEDAERDRARHPAGRPHDRVPARDRDAAAVLGLRGRRPRAPARRSR